MFGRAAVSDASDSKKAYGIRYDPAASMDKSFNFKRPGAWMNITVDGGYNWSGGLNRHALGYVNNGADNVLVHASISNMNKTVSLATVNDSTMTLSPTTLWSMLTRTAPVFYRIPLFMGWHYELWQSAMSTFTPLEKDQYSSIEFSLNGSLFTVKDPTNSTAIQSGKPFNGEVIDMDIFTPIGDGSGDGASTFALFKKEGTMYAFGNYSGSQETRIIDKISVTESYGTNPNPPPPPVQPSEPTILSTRGIVGIVVGVLVLAALTFLLGRRTSGRSKNKNKEAIKVDANLSQHNQPLGNNKKHPETQGSKDAANVHDIEGKYLDTAYPESQTGSTEILPMAPITPIHQYIQEQLQALHDQKRVLQDQLQALQSSNHP
ncbi:hypothetical protein BG015_001736 [Linnemannia schmuckeri]|uniref:Uncharacterized protein n=1 Tax=Linnemannia schmuckeri TaxID=64567 RepID=A0A9P5S483_9FUNG|nr:hypothetical protein BG015_001736 [Linnemannia schmuckeri]